MLKLKLIIATAIAIVAIVVLSLNKAEALELPLPNGIEVNPTSNQVLNVGHSDSEQPLWERPLAPKELSPANGNSNSIGYKDHDKIRDDAEITVPTYLVQGPSDGDHLWSQEEIMKTYNASLCKVMKECDATIVTTQIPPSAEKSHTPNPDKPVQQAPQPSYEHPGDE